LNYVLTTAGTSPAKKRTQTWLATKLPNLFQLKESGIYYLRVKPRKQEQIRESLHTESLPVAVERMRQRMLELQVVKTAAAGT
jgi:hypothetical protein